MFLYDGGFPVGGYRELGGLGGHEEAVVQDGEPSYSCAEEERGNVSRRGMEGKNDGGVAVRSPEKRSADFTWNHTSDHAPV